MRKIRRKRVAVASMAVALAAAGSAAAFQQLPANDQVNNDPAAGINPALGVSGEDPTNADVVGGVARRDEGERAVGDLPTVRHRRARRTRSSRARSRAGPGRRAVIGTVGGTLERHSDDSSGSLNFDQGQDGEAPAIDFAGPDRTVPWATWYEDTSGPASALEQHLRQPIRQQPAMRTRASGSSKVRAVGPAAGTVQVPSLNIHTNRMPRIRSSPAAPRSPANDPGPWVTWQEIDGARRAGQEQIFTSKAVKPRPGCPNDGDGPDQAARRPVRSAASAASRSASSGWRPRRPASASAPRDPSMNVDRTRDGIEPDIAFTGPERHGAVGRLVRDRTHSGDGLSNNEMVFAAKASTRRAAGRRSSRDASDRRLRLASTVGNGTDRACYGTRRTRQLLRRASQRAAVLA